MQPQGSFPCSQEATYHMVPSWDTDSSHYSTPYCCGVPQHAFMYTIHCDNRQFEQNISVILVSQTLLWN
jgi:hypothetical protein